MKHIKDEDDITKGCPTTHMRNPSLKALFESYVAEYEPDLSLHMKPDAPHYSSKDTRIAYNEFSDRYRHHVLRT